MQFELTKDFIDHLIDIIDRKDEKTALSIMEELHAADIAEIYDELNIEQGKFLYLLLDADKASDVLAELEDDDREKFLLALPSELIARQFIEEMDSDDAADVLADLPSEKIDEVLSHIEDIEQAGDIVDLLSYDEDTAGGLMAKELISVNENWDVNSCIEEIRKQAEEVEDVYNVYVIDDDSKLRGLLSLKKLILTNPKTKIAAICQSDIKFVKTNMPSEDVANIMQKYDLVSIPVVDNIGRLVGRITIDDVVDVMQEEAEKDYQMASGITEDVESSDKIWVQIRARLPWLLIGMVGGTFGALVLGNFEGDIMKYAGLAFFIPMINAMAGNVGVQSSAIVVQSLANKSIGIESIASKLFRELGVGLINGIICSGLIFAFNLLVYDNLPLTITVSLSLFSVIIFASVFGTFIPLALNRFKIDPAVATGPFITTVNDIVGLIIYLFMGRMLFAMYL
ncbi:MAG: magnesium transporter [Bacteroidales bacterium]|nr:magnesium transporter [Bacteroidales bacterium]